MSALLKDKQILTLFVCSFAVLFTGMGLLPILPLFAAQFDAGSSATGFYLAIIYAAYSLGPVVTGWLITRFSRKRVFLIGAAAGAPALLGLGQAQNFSQVIVFTALVWFSGGMVLSLISILTGEATDESNRGRAFSLMALVGPLGSLVGGAAIGRLIAWSGYAGMFSASAAVWCAIPLVGGLFLQDDPREKPQPARAASPVRARFPLGVNFTYAAAITFLGAVAVNVSRFGSSLSMQAQHYSPEAVSSVTMVSGLIAIPATLLIGAGSDRLGRKHFLFTGYLFAVGGAFILAGAYALWQFSLASILNLLAYSISGAMAQALTGDVVPPQAVSRGLAYLNILGAAANILCFAIGGLVFDLLDSSTVFIIAAALALTAAAATETLIHTARKGVEAAPARAVNA